MKNLNLPIIMDFDDVLVFQNEIFYNIIRKKWRKYSLFFKNLGSLSLKEIYARDEFKFSEWLWNDTFKNIEGEQKDAARKKVMDEFVKDVFSKDVYSELKPTPFAIRTLMNELYIDSPNVKKVYILSRNASPEMEEYKKKFAAKYFNNPKIEFVFIGLGEKKSDAIKRLNIPWGLYVEDEIQNIRDVAEKENLEGKEFLIPRYGYNKMPVDLSLLINGKGGTFSYFDPFPEEK